MTPSSTLYKTFGIADDENAPAIDLEVLRLRLSGDILRRNQSAYVRKQLLWRSASLTRVRPFSFGGLGRAGEIPGNPLALFQLGSVQELWQPATPLRGYNSARICGHIAQCVDHVRRPDFGMGLAIDVDGPQNTLCQKYCVCNRTWQGELAIGVDGVPTLLSYFVAERICLR